MEWKRSVDGWVSMAIHGVGCAETELRYGHIGLVDGWSVNIQSSVNRLFVQGDEVHVISAWHPLARFTFPVCRKHTSYTYRKKIKCGRIFPTHVQSIFYKVQEAFHKSEPILSH